MSKRCYESGAQKRAKQVRKSAELNRLAGSLDKFFKRGESSSISNTNLIEICNSNKISNNPQIESSTLSAKFKYDILDPATWPVEIDNKQRMFLVEQSPKCIKGNIFCFCCRLFSSIKISLTYGGFSDYAHTGKRLSEHESSKEHLESAYKWRILEFNIKRKTGIDHLNEDVFNKEKRRWQIILKCIVKAVLFSSERNLAFRGSNEKLFEPNNVMIDSTPDFRKKDQLSIIIRYVKITDHKPSIQESFLSFVNILSSTGKNLANVLIEELRVFGIKIADCRGQSYDNASNMKGEYKGVKSRILEINNKAW
ncbi:uncharacterized protein LOC136083401 [Hydra vulgaris]|uniref:Uncharacterized protein LOC136083401 n=1 Tax=Hydra vulgaris TaxID=6087 RepID=A0ABM4CB30_HYDVU